MYRPRCLPLLCALALTLMAAAASAVDLGTAFNQQYRLDAASGQLRIPDASSIGPITAFAVGDFNCDGRIDLAVGAAGSKFGNLEDAGAVTYASGNELTGLGNPGRSLRQGDTVVSGALEAGDLFGQALASADFDTDGCDDLVIGIPGEDTVQPVAENAGQVLLLRGAATGLTGSGRRYLPPANSTGNNGVVGGHFKGAALATPRRLTSASSGPFLAIGAPGHDGFPVTNSGGISVRRNTGSGVPLEGVVGFYERFQISGESSRWGDLMGARMASGDFNGDGFDDLVGSLDTEDGCVVIGLPSFCLERRGAVIALYGGTTANLSAELIHRGLPGVNGSTADFARYGAAIAVGDFDGDGFDDLAIGAPAPGSVAASLPGRVGILYGSATGLLGARPRSQNLSQGSLPGFTASGTDEFGIALASGDFNADGYEDLAIGVPGVNGERGRVLVIYGSPTGLLTNRVTELRNGLTGMPPAVNGQRFGSKLIAGDFNNDGADDLAIAQLNPGNVLNAPIVNLIYASSPTSLSIFQIDPSPSLIGATYRVRVLARRQDPGNAVRSRGSVTITDGLGNSCQATIAASTGLGSCNLPGNTLGPRTITATYAGVIGFQPNTATRVHEVVSQLPPPDLIFANGFEVGL